MCPRFLHVHNVTNQLFTSAGCAPPDSDNMVVEKSYGRPLLPEQQRERLLDGIVCALCNFCAFRSAASMNRAVASASSSFLRSEKTTLYNSITHKTISYNMRRRSCSAARRSSSANVVPFYVHPDATVFALRLSSSFPSRYSPREPYAAIVRTRREVPV